MSESDFFKLAEDLVIKWKLDLKETHIEVLARAFESMYRRGRDNGLLDAQDMTSSELEWACFNIHHVEKNDI